jgi:hypothetical protein
LRAYSGLYTGKAGVFKENAACGSAFFAEEAHVFNKRQYWKGEGFGISSGFLRDVFGKASGNPEAFPNTSRIIYGSNPETGRMQPVFSKDGYSSSC